MRKWRPVDGSIELVIFSMYSLLNKRVTEILSVSVYSVVVELTKSSRMGARSYLYVTGGDTWQCKTCTSRDLGTL